MIHAKRLSHPCITSEARVSMARMVGVGLELIFHFGYSPHVHFPLLQLTDAAAAQPRAAGLPKEYRPKSSEGSIRRL